MSTATADWNTGTAEVLSVKGRWVLARCPFCRASHAHARESLGSTGVLAAACSISERPRAYSLPDRTHDKEKKR